jgi:Cyclic nucleotide-binding domain/Ion channel
MKKVTLEYWLDIIWSIIVIVAITSVAMYLPLHLVRNIDRNLFSDTRTAIVSVIFIADIVYNVYVATRQSTIARQQRRRENETALERYIRRRLGIDIIAALPFSFLVGDHSWVIVFQLLKMVRVSDIFTRWSQLLLNYVIRLRLFFLIYWMAMVAHWVACGWILIHGAPRGVPFGDYYLKSLYWAITTLSTVGYGDITPKTNIEIGYAIAVMVLGVISFGYVIGNIANLLASFDTNRERYYEQAKRVQAFLKVRRIPSALQKHIADYYRYYWERQSGYDESSILQELPPGLRGKVSMFLRRDIIEKASIFADMPEEFIHDMAQHLRSELYTPGDALFKVGEIGDKMYFVSHGTLEVLDANSENIAVLGEGDLFGEIALLLGRTRTATVRALDYCDVYVLDAAAFNTLLATHPDFGERIKEISTVEVSANEWRRVVRRSKTAAATALLR